MERWERWGVGSAEVAAHLAPTEALVARQGGIGMYDGSEKVPDMSCGTLVLTTHRLAYVDDARPLDQSRYVRLALVQQTEHYAGFLKSSPKITLLLRDGREGGAWTCRVCAFENTTSLDGRCALCGVVRASEDVQESVACAACTFLNHPTLPRCELCETPLPKARTGPLAVKLSFRQGGDKPFYAHLRATLLAKAWKTEAARAAAGIDGVISKDTHAAAPAPDAFQDLEALMHQARSMVDLASSLRTQLERRERLLAQDGRTSHDGADSMIHSALVQLGLAAPAVTQDMVQSEAEYHRELARELSHLLLGDATRDGLLAKRKLLALDEVWGFWNRARGTVMRAAIAHLPDVAEPPIALRVLSSGLSVLHTPHYDDAVFDARILAYLDASSCTTLELAAHEGLPYPLLHELLEGMEQRCTYLVRDECGTHGTRWFRNTLLYIGRRT